MPTILLEEINNFAINHVLENNPLLRLFNNLGKKDMDTINRYGLSVESKINEDVLNMKMEDAENKIEIISSIIHDEPYLSKLIIKNNNQYLLLIQKVLLERKTVFIVAIKGFPSFQIEESNFYNNNKIISEEELNCNLYNDIRAMAENPNKIKKLVEQLAFADFDSMRKYSNIPYKKTPTDVIQYSDDSGYLSVHSIYENYEIKFLIVCSENAIHLLYYPGILIPVGFNFI